eukprot:5947231-Amphidinium_carterae.1
MGSQDFTNRIIWRRTKKQWNIAFCRFGRIRFQARFRVGREWGPGNSCSSGLSERIWHKMQLFALAEGLPKIAPRLGQMLGATIEGTQGPRWPIARASMHTANNYQKRKLQIAPKCRRS